MEPERATMSFEDKRAAFLKAVEKDGAGKGIIKEVAFFNNDIDEFLKQFKQFEDDSRRVELRTQ